jgi:hypothetical protein
LGTTAWAGPQRGGLGWLLMEWLVVWVGGLRLERGGRGRRAGLFPDLRVC